jgi:HlyD family secretion protein
MSKKFLVLFILISVLVLSACAPAADEGNITAFGIIAADDVSISTEIGGKIAEINKDEGDRVSAGDVLFSVDDEMLRIQRRQAAAAVNVAEAALANAQAQLESYTAQYELTLQGARLDNLENRQLTWSQAPLDEFNLPVWYFAKSEQITALEAEVRTAELELRVEKANLESELKNASNDDFVEAETKLAEAQTRYDVALQTFELAQAATDGDLLEDIAQEAVDAARADLEAAQLEYDRILTTAAAENILEARARYAVAQAQFDNATDRLSLLFSGEDSLQVTAAESAVKAAETGVAQAEAGLAQAKVALELVDLQLKKSEIVSPVDGVVLSSRLNVGELAGPGVTLLTIGKLDPVEVIVYIPEGQYGQIELGQQVSLSVDSFPGRPFAGEVAYISDEAEFTPRNVQTVEGRLTTVYAIKIIVENEDYVLKPGMPADVEFIAFR